MPSLITNTTPVGEIKDYGGGTVPANYLLCDGTSYPTATYPALFAVIGYTFGGAGANFNVPNTHRRTLVGSGGTGSGTLGNAVGAVGGEENHTLTLGELASHGHSISDPGHTHSVPSRTGQIESGGANFHVWVGPPIGVGPDSGTTVGASTTGVSVVANGSNTPHNTIQPSLVVTKMIRF